VKNVAKIPFRHTRLTPAVMHRTARAFAERMAARRSVRHFSGEPVPMEVIEEAIRAAATAPSGANIQPWRFVVITEYEHKQRLRQAAEQEEYEFYHGGRASNDWLQAVSPMGTDWEKPFLETAPVVIVVFEVHRGPNTPKPYYVKESVGIAIGMLITALHLSGLATLTHTPSPMKFLNEICGRPGEERACVVMPVGYPADGVTVPRLSRKPLSEVLVRP
jgi:iodotyrosine deiodinase